MTRTFVHAATGLFALALGVLTKEQATYAALAGVLLGWVVFPLTGVDRRLRRPGESYFGGLRTYPLAVFLLVVLLPAPQAAAAWAILAWGDSAARVIGTQIRSPSLVGHPKATWSGSSALFFVGGLAAWGCSAIVARACGLPASSLAVCCAASMLAVVADLLPLPPDDNLPIAAAAGIVLHLI